MSFLGIHHLRYAVENPENFARFLISKFGFSYYAIRGKNGDGESPPTIALKHRAVLFLICQRTEITSQDENGNDKIQFLDGNLNYPVDTCCDICFRCNNIDEIAKKSASLNSRAVVGRDEITDKHGTIKYVVLQTPIGNLQHTLIDFTNYSGKFLPGFDLVENYTSLKNELFSCIDHVALVVERAFSGEANAWYNFCFGFERLVINMDDDEEDGFLVQKGPMGLRLRALHGLNMCTTRCAADNAQPVDTFIPARIVIVESASEPTVEQDQIKLFINSHHGMGVQHVAFGTNNIMKTMQEMRKFGTEFVMPPVEYYSDKDKCKEIEDLTFPIKELEDYGVMIESSYGEYDSRTRETKLSSVEEIEPWYIMQAFTSNIFEERTLFMELIQRYHTEGGFGAGNIKALWNSLEEHYRKIEAIKN